MNKFLPVAATDFNVTKFEKTLHSREDFFIQVGEHRALELFHQAALHVPAYKDFLKKHGVRHADIKTIADFAKVPLTDKKNYIAKYSLAQRCWDGQVADSKFIAISSGTSGEPVFWPRSEYHDQEAAALHELLYKYFFNIDKHSTLVLIGFPMGMYVSGLATAIPTWLVSQKDYDMTMLTVGNSKDDMLKAVEALQKNYEQILLVGHPFFIKDVVETGKNKGIAWHKKNVHIMSCSEGFNEVWRNYVASLVSSKPDLATFINTYGSSEMLLMGFETPISILAKQQVEKKPSDLFVQQAGAALNLFQYNPQMRYIESVNRELVFTNAGQAPLIRFNMHDSGEVIPFKKIKEFLDANDADWQKKTEKWPVWNLPFVSLYGRSDKTIIFYAANIYPEHIQVGLNQAAFLKKLTGKFTMRKDYLPNMDQFLEINIELRPGVKDKAKLAKAIQKSVVAKLLKVNVEYAFLDKHLDKNITPRIKLWPYRSEKYFKAGLKPKYII